MKKKYRALDFMTYVLHSFKKKKEFQIKIIFFFKAAS